MEKITNKVTKALWACGREDTGEGLQKSTAKIRAQGSHRDPVRLVLSSSEMEELVVQNRIVAIFIPSKEDCQQKECLVEMNSYTDIFKVPNGTDAGIFGMTEPERRTSFSLGLHRNILFRTTIIREELQ